MSTDGLFPTDASGLPPAERSSIVDLADGDSFALRIGPVGKRFGDATVRMLAYNGSIPGPTLRVPQGARLAVDISNDGDVDATVHWHGLRLENRYDGTHQTQALIPIGGTFTANVEFPDPGIYWYHPHVRQDYGQEMGLYGPVVVVPSEAEYWPPVNRELVLTLDDILLEEGRVAPFSRSQTTHTAMGRFGDVMLVSGQTDLLLDAQAGEVVRLYLINTANTRVFNVGVTGARMKLVGGDSGHVEVEELVEAAILSPSERVVVDVLFPSPGVATLEHRTPEHTYTLASVTVGGEPVSPSYVREFETLRTNADLVAERERVASYFTAEPDKTLAFVAEMDLGGDANGGPYTCPMHPAVVSDLPGSCPDCGMKLLPAAMVAEAGGDHEHHDMHDHHDMPEHEHGHGDSQGIEWEDDMVEINKSTTPETMRWFIVDRATDARNTAIDWRFRVGDLVKIRLINELESDHPMHHPFHIHGAGRFLVLSRDETTEPNLVWKDTVLVRTGEIVDILLEVTNPGIWMAHCHIAEHHESGMMFSFQVDAR